MRIKCYIAMIRMSAVAEVELAWLRIPRFVVSVMQSPCSHAEAKVVVLHCYTPGFFTRKKEGRFRSLAWYYVLPGTDAWRWIEIVRVVVLCEEKFEELWKKCVLPDILSELKGAEAEYHEGAFE